MEKHYSVRVLIFFAGSLLLYLAMALSHTFDLARYILAWSVLNAVHLLMNWARKTRTQDRFSLSRLAGLLLALAFIGLNTQLLHWF